MAGGRASSSRLEELIAGKQTVWSESSTYDFCNLGGPQAADPDSRVTCGKVTLQSWPFLLHCRVHVIGCPPGLCPSHWLPALSAFPSAPPNISAYRTCFTSCSSHSLMSSRILVCLIWKATHLSICWLTVRVKTLCYQPQMGQTKAKGSFCTESTRLMQKGGKCLKKTRNKGTKGE